MIAAVFIGTWKPGKIDSAGELRQIRLGALLGAESMFLMAAGIVVAKPVLDTTDPVWTSMVRMMGGIAVLILPACSRTSRPDLIRCFRPGRFWIWGMPTALIGGYLAVLFWIMGMKYTYTTTASVLNQLSTIMILPLAALFLREPLTARKTVAVFLGVAGGVVAVL